MFASTNTNYVLFAHMLLPELRGGLFLVAVTRATLIARVPPLLGLLSPLILTTLDEFQPLKMLG